MSDISHDNIIIKELADIKRMIAQQQPITPRWLTMTQASAYCNKSKNWLREKLLSGEITGIQNVGKAGCEGNWTVDKQSIDEFFLCDSRKINEKLSSLKL